jgi:Tfp pilus assembly protein PilO
MSRLSRKVSEINEKIDFTNRTVVKMAQREETLERLTAELESYAGGFPREKEISRLLEKISSTAKDEGVKISTINPSELDPIKTGKDKVYYYALPISVKAKSGYHELASFISEVESGKRYLDVQGLKLQYNRNTPRKHDVRILIKTYVAGEGEGS